MQPSDWVGSQHDEREAAAGHDLAGHWPAPEPNLFDTCVTIVSKMARASDALVETMSQRDDDAGGRVTADALKPTPRRT
jgi:hypothetical protein